MYFDFKQSTAAARCVKCIVSKQENNAYLNFSRAKCQSMPARNRTAIFEWKFETERLLKIVSTLRKVLQSHYADKRVLRNYSACQRLCGKTSARDDASLKKFRFRVTEFPVINTVNCTSNIQRVAREVMASGFGSTFGCKGFRSGGIFPICLSSTHA